MLRGMNAAALHTYFDGEKNAGLLLAGIGLAILAGAVAIFPARYELRPLAWTLLVFGVAELAIALGLYLKTGPQVAHLLSQLAEEPAAFFAAERPRMVHVQRNFVLLEIFWVSLIAVGAVV